MTSFYPTLSSEISVFRRIRRDQFYRVSLHNLFSCWMITDVLLEKLTMKVSSSPFYYWHHCILFRRKGGARRDTYFMWLAPLILSLTWLYERSSICVFRWHAFWRRFHVISFASFLHSSSRLSDVNENWRDMFWHIDFLSIPSEMTIDR